MSDDDWYRRTQWTAGDRAAFFERLGRSRTLYNKSQYLRIQAGYLGRTDPSAALELLQLVLDDYPDPSQLAAAHLQLAQCRLQLGEPDEAVRQFRKALEMEALHPKYRTHAFLDFAMFVVSSRRRDLYGEIERALHENERWLFFPADRFQFHAALAVIADAGGDTPGAATHARAALAAAEAKHSGVRHHPSVGIVREPDVDLRQRLEALARSG